MFLKLLVYLEGKGQKYYAQDMNRLHNGVTGFVVGKMFQEHSIVLVGEDNCGGVCGFLIGGIIQYPPFFEHELLGEVQWMYPLSLEENPIFSRQISRAFEVWARTKGCTAGSNYCLPGNVEAQKLMAHDGREHVFNYYIKPYPAIGGEND